MQNSIGNQYRIHPDVYHTAQKKQFITKRRRRRTKWSRRKRYTPVPYQVAKTWVQRMGFTGRRNYERYQQRYKLPPGIPTHPLSAYGDEYEGDRIFYGKRPPVILPYPQAKQLVRHLGIKTHAQYVEYQQKYEQSKPFMKLPRAPHRVKSWQPFFKGFTDFLETHDQIHNTRRKLLSYHEARAYVSQLGIKSRQEWFDYVNSGKLPPFIPRRPERVTSYKPHWKGLSSWLGLDVLSAMDLRQESPGVWTLLHDPSDPPNQLLWVVFNGGKHQAQEICNERGMTIIRMYDYERDLHDDIDHIIRLHSSSYDGKCVITPNVNQLRYELDMRLLMINWMR